MGMAGSAHDVLPTLHQQCIIGVVDRGCGAVFAGRGVELGGDLGLLDHHRLIRNHALALHLSPYLRPNGQYAPGCCGSPLRVDIGPRLAEDGGRWELHQVPHGPLSGCGGICGPHTDGLDIIKPTNFLGTSANASPCQTAVSPVQQTHDVTVAHRDGLRWKAIDLLFVKQMQQHVRK